MDYGSYDRILRCYDMEVAPLASNERRIALGRSGKVLLPVTCLEHLLATEAMADGPVFFAITNTKLIGKRLPQNTLAKTHVGVEEFCAEEGRIYLPRWVMEELDLVPGAHVHVSQTHLLQAAFAKFEPQSTDFLDISDPKAVLERSLASFSCLTLNEIIMLDYNDTNYRIKIIDLKPEPAVSIINTDMQVDFAPPVGFDERKYIKDLQKRSAKSAGNRFLAEFNDHFNEARDAQKDFPIPHSLAFGFGSKLARFQPVKGQPFPAIPIPALSSMPTSLGAGQKLAAFSGRGVTVSGKLPSTSSSRLYTTNVLASSSTNNINSDATHLDDSEDDQLPYIKYRLIFTYRAKTSKSSKDTAADLAVPPMSKRDSYFDKFAPNSGRKLHIPK